jgi:RNA polymerase sigma factor (sigma-70 family)
VTAQRKRGALTQQQQQLVEEALPTAHALIRRAIQLKGIHTPSELDEVDQVVSEVLCRAALRYDEQRPTGFLNFAWKAMFGAAAEILGSLRAVHARALEVALDGAAAIEDGGDPFTEAEEDDRREIDLAATAFVFDLHIVDTIEANAALHDERTKALAELEASLIALDTGEIRVVKSRFWEGAKIAEIALEMGVSESTVKRLVASACKKLRHGLIERGVHEVPPHEP